MTIKILLISLCFHSISTADDAFQELTSANNKFTSEIYKEIQKKEEGNFLTSPFSIEAILSLIQSGAKNSTAEELKTTLHLLSRKKLENAYKALRADFGKNGTYSLRAANKIYLKSGLEVKDEFRNIATEVFGAEVENIDFGKNKKAAATINEWVENRTENKIKNLLRENSLDDRTRAILINTLYFKGTWLRGFSWTHKRDFYKSGKETVKVNMMQSTFSCQYYESADLDAKFIELPFKGDDVSMTFVLPNEKEGISSLENQLGKLLDRPQYQTETLNIFALPKFSIESRFNFKEMLQNLGVSRAFSNEADFSGIAGEKDDFFVDDVVQKTFIDVNEGGVEVAAATSGGFVSFIVREKKFLADHPFIFYIKLKDLVIFVGRVMDPSQ